MTTIEKKLARITFVGVLILCIGFPIWFYIFALPAETSNSWGFTAPSPPTQKYGQKIIKLQERTKNADEFALRGNQLAANKKYIAASFYYLRCLIELPHYPITKPRKEAYQRQFRRNFGNIFKG